MSELLNELLSISNIFVLAFLCLSMTFSKNALHMFQQNRYELYRYTKWLFNKKNLHFSWGLVFIIANLLLRALFGVRKISARAYLLILLSLTVICAIYFLVKENNKEYVKDLVYTSRVKRQIVIFTILLFLIIYFSVLNIGVTYLPIISIYSPYLLIYVLYIITEPFERGIKNSYEKKAKKIIDGYDDLIKVGITGSFGKTSTKNIVTNIISDKFYSLMTPASYNTPMGITRTIREMLKPIHEVFVCEMGADHKGEISHLMNFVKPKYGIVTSIGPQHLNTFKSLDNIIHEKMEMIEKLPTDGVGIINVDNGYINEYKIKNNCKIIRCGIKNTDADIVAYDIKYSNSGSSFKVNFGKKTYTFKTCLLGEHNIMNVLLAIALANELGMSIKEISDGVLNVKQVEHRLEIKKINGLTFIDNAFNSNPISSKLSLDVIEKMPKKRVIVTPGLIDLGKSEDDYNYEFGRYMVNRVDIVILVGEKNSIYIKKGLLKEGFDENNLIVVDSVKEAFNYCYSNLNEKDVILLENDLPDAFLYV